MSSVHFGQLAWQFKSVRRQSCHAILGGTSTDSSPRDALLNQAISTIPRRWLEAYAACVCSPLELKSYVLFRALGPLGARFFIK